MTFRMPAEWALHDWVWIGFPSNAAEWPVYGATNAATKYSPLDQIDASNVATLEVAWEWTSPDAAILEAHPELQPGEFQATPIMVDGRLWGKIVCQNEVPRVPPHNTRAIALGFCEVVSSIVSSKLRWIESQAALWPMPTGLTIPSPVTTTRRCLAVMVNNFSLNRKQKKKAAQWPPFLSSSKAETLRLISCES